MTPDAALEAVRLAGFTSVEAHALVTKSRALGLDVLDVVMAIRGGGRPPQVVDDHERRSSDQVRASARRGRHSRSHGGPRPTIVITGVPELIASLTVTLNRLRDQLPPVLIKDGVADNDVERSAATMRMAAEIRLASTIRMYIGRTLEAAGVSRHDAEAAESVWKMVEATPEWLSFARETTWSP